MAYLLREDDVRRLLTMDEALKAPRCRGMFSASPRATARKAAGSNYADKRELDATAVERASRIVVDDLALARIESGDLLAAEAQSALDWSAVHALSDLVAGKVPGRASADEITLFESHGLALEDLAVAACVLDLARERGMGMEIPIK